VRAADWLWANPLLRREWAQRRRPESRPAAAAAWLGLLLLLVSYAGSAGWLTQEQRSPWEARAFLLGACLLYLLWVSISTPGLAAVRIAGERERRTWQALLLTALRPSQVVSAKLLSSLVVPVSSLALWLPLLVMGAHAARLPFGRLVLILGVLLASAVTVAAGTLWLSGRFRRSLTAATLAYLLTGSCFWVALTSSPAHLIRGENLWWYLSPAWHAAILCLAEPLPSPLARPVLPEWVWFLFGCTAVTGMSIGLLTQRVAASDE
jgi:ABC-type Na+ efflux pump permease subunit